MEAERQVYADSRYAQVPSRLACEVGSFEAKEVGKRQCRDVTAGFIEMKVTFVVFLMNYMYSIRTV